MSTENKLSIKHVIKFYPFLSVALLTRTDKAIEEFAQKCGLPTQFIVAHFDTIRYWI